MRWFVYNSKVSIILGDLVDSAFRFEQALEFHTMFEWHVIGAVPKAVVCEFSSHASMMAAVRNQKAILSMEGLWMSPDRPLEDCLKYQRLFKVKRGIIEATKRPGDEIVVDKPLRKIFAVSGDNLVEICHVPFVGEITWSDSIQPHVRAHVAQVLGE